MHNSTNGTIIELTSGPYTALVASVGATLVSLKKDGRDIIVPFPVDEMPDGFAGKVLAPWPNRIREGVYTFAETRHQLAISEVETGSAAHGLVNWTDWEVTGQGPTSAAFAVSVHPQPGYPFAVRLEVTYSLDPDAGLVCIVAAENTGSTPAPYGAAVHPYLSCDGKPVDDCMLLLPAASVLEVDQLLLPTSLRSVADTPWDFRTARQIGDTRIDNAFTQLPPQEWNVDLIDPTNGMTVRLTSDEKWVQIYSGEKLDRRGIAVEPMTCPPDAFNSGVDVIELGPGDLTTLTYSIREV